MYERQINTYIAAFLGLIGEVKLMEYDVFKTPLKVFLGIGVARDIHTVTQAYAWLHNCRTAMRREAHVNALQACKAAFSRQLSAEAAQNHPQRSRKAALRHCPDHLANPARHLMWRLQAVQRENHWRIHSTSLACHHDLRNSVQRRRSNH